MNHLLTALLLATPALAQSPVVGFSYNGTTGLRSSFSTTTDDFVGHWVATPPSTLSYREFDLDATATIAYSFNFTTSQLGTVDLATSVLTPFGPSGIPGSSIYGFTAHPDGTTWYAMSRSGTDCQLYRGSMVAGSFVPVGGVQSGYAFMNLACDGAGNLYSIDVISDALYRINVLTGVPMLVGPIGLPLNYTHGLDFDWSTGWLYACLITSGVTESYFARLDPNSGAILDAQDTLVFNSQMRMAIAQPSPLLTTDISTFCVPANANSTGSATFLVGNPSGVAGSGLHLDAINGPPTNFGYFLVGSAPNEPGTPISFGRLCLSTAPGSSLGRYNLAGTARNSLGVFNGFGVLENLSSTSSTSFGFDVPMALPLAGSPWILAGSTWYFQLWHRDNRAGIGASNFSSGIRATF
ncbi:MAG TPA: hypothetical protein P5218_00065 [Planctomycetota bacterium]|nr:hypothetical protein [Planctomycetota bacterium]HPF12619.1 hypothetical protein [Planctomycetota bacterium]HRV79793.1 hypothetical protein [Planctomycetota bacterium]